MIKSFTQTKIHLFNIKKDFTNLRLDLKSYAKKTNKNNKYVLKKKSYRKNFDFDFYNDSLGLLKKNNYKHQKDRYVDFFKSILFSEDYFKLEEKKLLLTILLNFSDFSNSNKKFILSLKLDKTSKELGSLNLKDYFLKSLRYDKIFDTLLQENYSISKKSNHDPEFSNRNYKTKSDSFYQGILVIVNAYSNFYNFYSKDDLEYFSYYLLKEFLSYLDFNKKYDTTNWDPKNENLDLKNLLAFVEFFLYIKFKYMDNNSIKVNPEPSPITIHIFKPLLTQYLVNSFKKWYFNYQYFHYLMAFSQVFVKLEYNHFKNEFEKDLQLNENNLSMRGNFDSYLELDSITKSRMKNYFFDKEFNNLHDLNLPYAKQFLYNMYIQENSSHALNYYSYISTISKFKFNRSLTKDNISLNLIRKLYRKMVFLKMKNNIERIKYVYKLAFLLNLYSIKNCNISNLCEFYTNFLDFTDRYNYSLNHNLLEKQFSQFFNSFEKIFHIFFSIKSTFSKQRLNSFYTSTGNILVKKNSCLKNKRKYNFHTFNSNKINHLRVSLPRKTFKKNVINESDRFFDIHSKKSKENIEFVRDTYLKKYPKHLNSKCILQALTVLGNYDTLFIPENNTDNKTKLNKNILRINRTFMAGTYGIFKNIHKRSMYDNYNFVKTNYFHLVLDYQNLLRNKTLEKRLYLDYNVSYNYFFLNYFKILVKSSNSTSSLYSLALITFVLFKKYKILWHLPLKNYLFFRMKYLEYSGFELDEISNPDYYCFDKFIRNSINARDKSIVNYYLSKETITIILKISLVLFYVSKRKNRSLRYLLAFINISSNSNVKLSNITNSRKKLLYLLNVYFRKINKKNINRIKSIIKVLNLSKEETKYILSNK